MTEQQEKLIADIIGTTCAILFIIAFITALIIWFIHQYKTIKMKQDYIKTLDEHDKAVITTYENTFYTMRKKQNEKV